MLTHCSLCLLLDNLRDKDSYWTLRRRAKRLVETWTVHNVEESVNNDSDKDTESLDHNTYYPQDVNKNSSDLTNTSTLFMQSVGCHNSGYELSNESNLCAPQCMPTCSNEAFGDDNGSSHENYDEYHFLSDEELSDNENLVDQISKWAISEKMKSSAVDKLLHILKPYHPELPLSCKTLLNTKAHNFDVRKISGGEFVYFGILRGIMQLEADVIKACTDTIELQVNIDGVPLFRSSNAQLWPILGRVVGLKQPFIIGAFCGSTKPLNVNEFLSDFIMEASTLHSSGLNLGDHCFKFQIQCFICDAPARAFIKQTKLHSGYFGCDRCTEKGKYVQGRVTFPALDASKRTDDLFSRLQYPDHQLARSPLIDLNIGVVSSCVLDYMHLVCLGITRRIIHFWLKGPLSVRFSSQQIKIISEKLLSLRSSIPCEFARKPRSLSDLEHWKASEFRLFLLYTGIVVLKELKANKQIIEHFICLNVIMHILLNPTLFSDYGTDVDELSVSWVRKCALLYGEHFIVYNIHSFIHLADDCHTYGNLNEISAFPFENFMRFLKGSIHKPQQVLQQLSNRLCEGFFDHIGDIEVSFGVSKEHYSGPVVAGLITYKQYKQLEMNGFRLTLDTPDNCIMIESKVFLIVNIFSDGHNISLLVQKFKRQKEFFKKPIKSSHIGIFRVSKIDKKLLIYSSCEITAKVVLMPYRKKQWIAVPINHSH